MKYRDLIEALGARLLLGVFCLISSGIFAGSTAFGQATYTYTGNNFDTVLGAYTTSMRNVGEFTMSAQLPPYMPVGTDISAQVLSYSFNDGVQTLTEANSYIVNFLVGTNFFCEISDWSITIWQGDSLVSGIDITVHSGPPAASTDYGYQGVPCSATANGECIDPLIVIDNGTDYGQLFSIPPTPGVWVGPDCRQPQGEAIPTLDLWSVTLLVGLIFAAALWVLARGRNS